MITENEKDTVFNEMVFNKSLYYEVDENGEHRQKSGYKRLEDDFKTKDDFKTRVNRLLHTNSLWFFNKSRFLNEAEFLKFIKSQYRFYNYYTPNNQINWLKHTDKIIMGGVGFLRFNKKELQDVFLEWVETLNIKTPKKRSEKSEKKHLIDLFKNVNEYNRIIKLLIENQFITTNTDNTLNWIKVKEDGLESLKLICVLGAKLKDTLYFEKTSQTEIAKLLTSTFIDYDISKQYYGTVLKEIESGMDKTQEYYTSFYFIPKL